MVTVHQSSVVLGTGSTFFVPQGEFYHFFVFCTFYGLTIHWVQKVFFSSATFAVRFCSVSKPTHLRPEPRPRVAKPRENDDRLFERIYSDFCACFSVFKTWPKAETAQEKPLVVLSQERVALSSKSLFNFLCQSQILK